MKSSGLLQPTGYLCVILALMLLYVPLEWLGAAMLAGVTHEAFHAAAVRLCGGKIPSIRIGTGGAVMSASALEGWRQPVCLLAGPLGGLSLIFAARWLPRTALCAAVHSFYNLLPGDQLDGGRILRWVLDRLLPDGRADTICRRIQNGVCAVLIVAGFTAVWIWKLGWFAALVTGWLVYRTSCRKGA